MTTIASSPGVRRAQRRRWRRLWQKPPWADPSWHLEPPPPELVLVVEDASAPDGAALDVGCGAGAATSYLSNHFRPAVGVDFVPAAIVEARRVAAAHGTGPRFLLGEAPMLPFRPEMFSLILDRGCLQNVSRKDWPAYFAELHRLLVPGGVVLLCITRPLRRFPPLLSYQGLKRRLGWVIRRRGRPRFPDRGELQSLGGGLLAPIRLEDFPFQPRKGPLCTMTLAEFRKVAGGARDLPVPTPIARPDRVARERRPSMPIGRQPSRVREALLETHRTRVDVRAGIREEFLQPKLGSGKTVAVLARPLGPALPVGWVLSHSFGVEEMNLDRLHVLVARALATAGFPTIRFACQGYGDSDGRGHPPRLADHLEGTLDAVELMSSHDAVESVGIFGSRFGAMVGALAAERADLSLVALCQPFASGRLFLEDCFWPALLKDKLRRARRAQPAGIAHELAVAGSADVDGFLLTREAFDEIAALDLTRDLTRFSGRALVLGISRGGGMPSGPGHLAAHLRTLGADCLEVSLADRWGQVFGQHQYQRLPDMSEIDTQHESSPSIARSVVSWALEKIGSVDVAGRKAHS